MKKLIYVLFAIFLLWACSKEDNTPVQTDNSLITAKQILDEVNLARTNITYYISLLENMKQYFDGTLYKEPGEITLQTSEGVAAVNDAINSLKSYNTINALIMSNGLCKAASDHVKDIGNKGITGHTGTDGSTPFDRMNRYGKWNISAAECCAYGNKTARKIVLQLIIDDGISDRGHRDAIYDNNLKYFGAAFGTHSIYNYMAVLDFAVEYTEKISI